jgi:type IV pilus assembly protein PilO
MKMKKIDISTQTIQPYIEKIEKLTKTQRILASIGVIVLIIGAFVYFSILPKIEQINKLSKEYDELNAKVIKMKADASQLAMYRNMMKDAEAQFRVVRKALPDNKEIPALLTSISQSGHDSGLEFLLFEPQNEEMKDFYTEIPVSISVSGNYHNVGLFLSKVASLPRVVNVRNLQMTPLAAKEKEEASLTTSCTAVTYRFVEKQPETQPKDDKNKKK